MGCGFLPLQVHLVRDATALDAAVGEYDATLRALTDLTEHYLYRQRHRLPLKPKKVRHLYCKLLHFCLRGSTILPVWERWLPYCSQARCLVQRCPACRPAPACRWW